MKIGVWSDTLSQMELTDLVRWSCALGSWPCPAWPTWPSGGSATGSSRCASTRPPPGPRRPPRRRGARRPGRHRPRRGGLPRHAQPAPRGAPGDGAVAPPPSSPRCPSDRAAQRAPPRRRRHRRRGPRPPHRRRGHQRPPGAPAHRREAARRATPWRSPAASRPPSPRSAPRCAGVHVDPTIFRPATFIERAMATSARPWCRVRAGGADPRALPLRVAHGAHLATAIPLSLLAAVVVLRLRGGTLDTMTLAGLAIALGEVVDDAIIDVENIVRRLQQNRALPTRARPSAWCSRPRWRCAAPWSTRALIVVLVFLPVFFLDGLAGSFFRPLAVAYALGVRPPWWSPSRSPPPSRCCSSRAHLDHRPAPLADLAARPLRAPPAGRGRPPAPRWPGAGAAPSTAARCPLLGEGFLPTFQETDFLMHWVGSPAPPSTPCAAPPPG
jgi:hypothetical protein